MKIPEGASRVPKIKDQGSFGLVVDARERHKSPIIIPGEDFPIALQKQIAGIRERDHLNPQCVFTLEDNVLCIDGIPLEQWMSERKEVITRAKETGSVREGLDPKHFVRRKNGSWAIEERRH